METTPHVGQVKYFVRADPADAAARAALEGLGLPTVPQKFAMVQAYKAHNVQAACPMWTRSCRSRGARP